MKPQFDDPFATIESAHAFVALLARSMAEARRELEGDLQRESDPGQSRRLDALRPAQYSLGKLEVHMHQSGRILNDLRTLRRLLFEERGLIAHETTTESDMPGQRRVAA